MKAATTPDKSLSRRAQMKQVVADSATKDLLFGHEPKFQPEDRKTVIEAASKRMDVDAKSLKLGDRDEHTIKSPSQSGVDADRVKNSRDLVDEGQAQVDSFVYAYTYNPIYGTRHTRVNGKKNGGVVNIGGSNSHSLKAATAKTEASSGSIDKPEAKPRTEPLTASELEKAVKNAEYGVALHQATTYMDVDEMHQIKDLEKMNTKFQMKLDQNLWAAKQSKYSTPGWKPDKNEMSA